jgi:homoaconitate hydratase
VAQNLVEKIAQRFAVELDSGHEVHSGDYIYIQPAHVMTHDNTGAVIPKFKSIGATRVANPSQIVFALDHNVQDKSEKNLLKYSKIETFAKEQGIDFYPAGRGIGHQIMCEEGYAWPGTMVVASDSHSNMYGGLGCLGTPIVRTDAAAIWATGKTWWQIPPVAKVDFSGTLRPGVTGKDVIIALCGLFNNDEVLNHAIEFTGEGVSTLSINDRLTIANMTTEWGALAGLFPIDDTPVDWLIERAKYIVERGLEGVASDDEGDGTHPRVRDAHIDELLVHKPVADADANYAKEITFDLNSVEPCVAGPNNLKTSTLVSDLRSQKLKIHKAYLVSCVNSRLDDILEAAGAIKGRSVADGVEFYIAAASSEVQKEAEYSGAWQTLLNAGAIPLPPGCGPCIGLGTGLLEAGEVGISATNRNFKGRMGSPDALAYLASPAVVAHSAAAGYIDYPHRFKGKSAIGSMAASTKEKSASRKVEIIDGFPDKISGEIIWCHQDNLNTDGIYPGKYTYQDDMTAEQQAEVVMENYDPEFRNIASKGNILVGGYNFGTGSSREQAATALKHFGIQLVIAGSASETYKRNAINNGFLVIESPKLVEELKSQFGSNAASTRTSIEAVVNIVDSEIVFGDKHFPIGPVGAAAQELILLGGLENWVKKSL